MRSGCQQWFWLAILALFVVMIIVFSGGRETDVITDGAGSRVYVVDGDTLRVGNRQLRLARIDAIELRQLCDASDRGQWSCGLDARQALEKMVTRGALVCESFGSDAYGRVIARCQAKEVPDIAAQLVAQGWALADPTPRLSRHRSGGGWDYLREEGEAKAAKRGIWRSRFERPADWRAAHPREGDE